MVPMAALGRSDVPSVVWDQHHCFCICWLIFSKRSLSSVAALTVKVDKRVGWISTTTLIIQNTLLPWQRPSWTSRRQTRIFALRYKWASIARLFSLFLLELHFAFLQFWISSSVKKEMGLYWFNLLFFQTKLAWVFLRPDVCRQTTSNFSKGNGLVLR